MRKHLQTGLFFTLPALGIAISAVAIWVLRQAPVNSAAIGIVLSFGILINLVLIALYCILLRNHQDAERYASQFEHQAYTDAMTQVRNRAAFDLKISEMDPARYPDLTLFMLDLNNLKDVNDSLGHLAGDQLICALVTCIKDTFGDLGQIYRYGGDEFIVMIEDAPLPLVRAAQAQFDKCIAEYDSGGAFDIFVAVGMASRQEEPYSGLHAGELLHAADAKMYQYKTRQKNLSAAFPIKRAPAAEQMDPVTGILSFTAFLSAVRQSMAETRSICPCIVNFDLNFYNNAYSRMDQATREFLLQELTKLARSLRADGGFCAHGEGDSFWVFVDARDMETLKTSITGETARMQSHALLAQMRPKFGIYRVTNPGMSVFDMCNCAIFAKKMIAGQPDSLYNVYMSEI